MKEYFKTIVPLGRIGASDEMGDFFLFMASDKASYMTGQCIAVDGGITISSPAIKLD